MSESGGSYRGFVTRRQTWCLAGHSLDLTSVRDPDALLDAPSTIRRFDQNEYMPYWAQLWPASVLLAEHILKGPAGEGRAAIELGCGIGLVSVAAAVAGWSVTASDHDEDALAFAALNAERNGVRLGGVALVDFVDQPADRHFDRIFASDVLYERRLAAPLVRWLASGLSRDGVALVSDPMRSAADGFEATLIRHGLRATVRRVAATMPSGLAARGRIWHVERGPETTVPIDHSG